MQDKHSGSANINPTIQAPLTITPCEKLGDPCSHTITASATELDTTYANALKKLIQNGAIPASAIPTMGPIWQLIARIAEQENLLHASAQEKDYARKAINTLTEIQNAQSVTSEITLRDKLAVHEILYTLDNDRIEFEHRAGISPSWKNYDYYWRIFLSSSKYIQPIPPREIPLLWSLEQHSAAANLLKQQHTANSPLPNEDNDLSENNSNISPPTDDHTLRKKKHWAFFHWIIGLTSILAAIFLPVFVPLATWLQIDLLSANCLGILAVILGSATLEYFISQKYWKNLHWLTVIACLSFYFIPHQFIILPLQQLLGLDLTLTLLISLSSVFIIVEFCIWLYTNQLTRQKIKTGFLTNIQRQYFASTLDPQHRLKTLLYISSLLALIGITFFIPPVYNLITNLAIVLNIGAFTAEFLVILALFTGCALLINYAMRDKQASIPKPEKETEQKASNIFLHNPLSIAWKFLFGTVCGLFYNYGMKHPITMMTSALITVICAIDACPGLQILPNIIHNWNMTITYGCISPVFPITAAIFGGIMIGQLFLVLADLIIRGRQSWIVQALNWLQKHYVDAAFLGIALAATFAAAAGVPFLMHFAGAWYASTLLFASYKPILLAIDTIKHPEKSIFSSTINILKYIGWLLVLPLMKLAEICNLYKPTNTINLKKEYGTFIRNADEAIVSAAWGLLLLPERFLLHIPKVLLRGALKTTSKILSYYGFDSASKRCQELDHTANGSLNRLLLNLDDRWQALKKNTHAHHLILLATGSYLSITMLSAAIHFMTTQELIIPLLIRPIHDAICFFIPMYNPTVVAATMLLVSLTFFLSCSILLLNKLSTSPSGEPGRFHQWTNKNPVIAIILIGVGAGMGMSALQALWPTVSYLIAAVILSIGASLVITYSNPTKLQITPTPERPASPILDYLRSSGLQASTPARPASPISHHSMQPPASQPLRKPLRGHTASPIPAPNGAAG